MNNTKIYKDVIYKNAQYCIVSTKMHNERCALLYLLPNYLITETHCTYVSKSVISCEDIFDYAFISFRARIV